MMRIAQATALLLVLGGAQAFTAPASFGVARHSAIHTVFMSEESSSEEPAEEVSPTALQEPTPEPSGLNISRVRKMVRKLSTDKFLSDLATMEPFLLHEAGSTFYTKSMKRISQKAKELGTSVPEGYALEAKATAKRRNKQNAFIQAKEDERLAAEAQAAAAAAEVAEEEEAPATAEVEAEAAVEEAEAVVEEAEPVAA